MKPEISLFASAVRPHCWMDYYNSIGQNDASFEVIFVGPIPPKFKLPRNFHYIYSTTKPAQCFEIGRRASYGNLLMNVSDDCEFQTEHPLDKLCETYYAHENEKVIISCRYMQNGVDRSEMDHLFFCDDPTSPVMPMHSLLSRKLYDEIGGIDRNFIAVFWDLDIAMRVYAIGGSVILSNVYSNEDKTKMGGSNLCATFGGLDRLLLNALWAFDGKVSFTRGLPVNPFLDYRLVEENQGPQGRWWGV